METVTNHELILPFHRDIFQSLEGLGVLQRTLIIGGNTLLIIRDIIGTGILPPNVPPANILSAKKQIENFTI